MNNYYTLRYLVAGIKRKLFGAIFVSANTAGKNIIDLLFEKSNEKLPLKVLVAPGNQLLFIDYPGKKAKTNTLGFFSGLEGRPVTGIELAESDRQIYILFGHDTRLIIQLYGSAGNIYYIEKGIIQESFKNPDRHRGRPEPLPRPPSVGQAELSGDIFRDLIKLNPLLPRNFLREIPMAIQMKNYTMKELVRAGSYLEEVLQNRLEPGINPDGRFNPWPGDVLPAPGKEVFDSVNRAVRTAFYASRKKDRFTQKFNMLQKLVTKQRDRYLKRIESLDQIEKSRERIEKHEQYGHLLMANLNMKPSAPDSVTVPDLFGEGEVVIAIKPGLSLAENAALYYEKAKKGKKSVEVASGKREDVLEKARISSQLLHSLNSAGSFNNSELLDNWLDENRSFLKHLNLDEEDILGESFPFRRTYIGRYEIWIGKNASNNDELLRAAHKEDVWMHARGVSGSHLIIRMSRAGSFPEPHILEKAARIAAWYSRAKTVGLAPVVYAKRKHVRKPKGSAPGQAVVDREQVLLVKPEPAEKNQHV